MKKIRDQPGATAQSSATVCFRATGPHPTPGTNCQIQNMGSGPAAPNLECGIRKKWITDMRLESPCHMIRHVTWALLGSCSGTSPLVPKP